MFLVYLIFLRAKGCSEKQISLLLQTLKSLLLVPCVAS